MRASSLLPLLAASPLVAGAPEGRRAAQNSMAQFKTDLANKNAAESIWDKIKTGTTCLGCQVRLSRETCAGRTILIFTT